MKTKFIAIFLFFFAILSSPAAFAESFVTSRLDPHIVVFRFAGKTASDTIAVPAFRHPLTMEIPSGIIGSGPLRFSYSLSDTGPMTFREALDTADKKSTKTEFLVVTFPNEDPVFISLNPGVTKTFYVVSSNGKNPASTNISKVTVRLVNANYNSESMSMSIDWTKIMPGLGNKK